MTASPAHDDSLETAPGGRPGTAEAGPLRILYSHYQLDDHNTSAQMVDRMADALRARGHEVHVHRSFGPPFSAPTGDAAPRRSPLARLKGGLWFIKALTRNRRMIRYDLQAVRDFRPDVILTRQDAYCFSMPHVARRLGVPMVTIADAPVAYETRVFAADVGRWHPPALVEAIERRTLRQSRAILTVSRPTAQRLARYGLNVPVHVVPNGFDPRWFPELTPDERRSRRQALGLTAPRVATFVGAFRPFHGVDLLRDLIAATAGRADTQWLLVGDGPKRPALQADFADRPDVLFLGRRPPEELGTLMALADVAVSPHPKFEGDYYFCPLKVIEYAAAGCAIAAAALGDIPTLLDDGRVGVLVDTPEPAPWRAAVARLLDDPAHATALGRAARRWAHDHYTWGHAARAFERVLWSAVGERPGEAERDPVSGVSSPATRHSPLAASEA